jgi:hypothetical protein
MRYNGVPKALAGLFQGAIRNARCVGMKQSVSV